LKLTAHKADKAIALSFQSLSSILLSGLVFFEYNKTSGKVVVTWSQDKFKTMQRDPKDLFI